MMNVIALILIFPLVGLFANLLLGWRLGERTVGLVAAASVTGAFLAALGGVTHLLGLAPEMRLLRLILFDWISIGDFHVNAGFMLDPLSSVMTLVITGVGALIHFYSMGYMHGDRGIVRYFIYLNLFVFFMLTLVLADNFLVLFVGWEGVGLCSYLLIGFWFNKESACEAGKKAFVFNRVGDFCFLVGLFLILSIFGTLDFSEVFSRAPTTIDAGSGIATAICLLLFAGATGKSAQIPLYVWLPDAMEGPTPVSALIHAATMVTAGVYMVARSYVLFSLSPVAMNVVAIVGAATLLVAASIALVQTDIKRVLAYSTVSQLGYMVLSLGVGAYSAAIFHLMTHAFFKALLFMGAGSVIHALDGEQEMSKMGGISAALPITSVTCTIAALAIAGVFPLAGFFSKDAILYSAMTSEHGGLLFWLAGAAGALMTSLYIFRLIFKTFHGKCNLTMEAQARLHESPRIMTVPLQILAALSIVGGWIGIPLIRGADIFGGFIESALGGHVEGHHEVFYEIMMMLISLAIAFLGIYIAYQLFIGNINGGAAYAERWPRLYRLVLNKYYVDEAYDCMVIQPIKRISRRMWKDFDDGFVDSFVGGVGDFVRLIGAAVRQLQTGFVKSYAITMLVGVLAVVLYFSVMK